jgi:type IV secretory pathway TrbF-like protein
MSKENTKNLTHPAGTEETLLDQLAQAIQDEATDLDWYACLIAADAVIKHLNLKQEYSYTRQRRRLSATDYRYVSNWKNDYKP